MKLYAWGANSHGQLGLGLCNDECRVPTEVKVLPPEIQENLTSVRAIVGGGGHTLLLTHDGVLYSAGWNSKGQLGYVTNKLEQKEFRCVEKLKDMRVTRIACGWDHSIAVTGAGKLFSWGSNSFHQLGIPKTRVPSHTVEPSEVELACVVVSVSAGLRHSAIVDDTGKVYVWGSGRQGQLGLTSDGEPLAEIEKPCIIPCKEEAVKVCCGQYHTVVQCRNGQVFVFGQNKKGQLSLPLHCTQVNSPCPVSETSWLGKGKLMEIFVGWTHCVAHTESGHLFTWGRGDYGQLGRGINSECDPKPVQVKLPGLAVAVAVGAEHCVSLLDTGAVAVWGWNEHGTCGLRESSNILSPTIIPQSLKEAAVSIGCGSGTTFMLVNETLPRPKERSLLSKVANVLGGVGMGVSGLTVDSKYSSVPGSTEAAQPAWDHGDGLVPESDGDMLLQRQSGRKKGAKIFSSKDGMPKV
ncbi:unnamed protein product [Notodromas monacha]|uniref:RCC1-like domain-containing protein n=1 Tax=Notodromas monacha TaxID=399045 RepID=A0A7R9BF41_9CRUS|nr:unnamed protein product [Notodromas monacha]CAG0914215.1 unnamed protein product [Notodromas monacha]